VDALSVTFCALQTHPAGRHLAWLLGIRRKIMLSHLLLLIFCFLPLGWNLEHAKDDIDKSDYSIRGRCIGIRLAESQGEDILKDDKRVPWYCRSYIAQIRVAETYKGSSLDGTVIEIDMGYSLESANKDTFEPAYEQLTMCNSQCGFNFKINQMYVVHLDKNKGGWEPRSGPFSIGWLKPENLICFGELGWKWQDNISSVDYLKTLRK
jgi:hypothetical protein